MSDDTSIIPIERVEQSIYLIRGHKVMLDRDLAVLYGVKTKALNQAVKRNADRFPSDFVFRLSDDETKELVTICDRFLTLKHSVGFHVREEPGVYRVLKIS
jgi:hypothetical protein